MQIVKNDDGEFLNVTQAAVLLNVSVDTIYRWTMRKQVPFYKVGKLVRFRRDELLAYIDSMRITPHAGD